MLSSFLITTFIQLHQHKSEQRKADASHYADKQFAVHGCTHLGHATHHTERTRDGGEYSNEDFEELAPVDLFHTCLVFSV